MRETLKGKNKKYFDCKFKAMEFGNKLKGGFNLVERVLPGYMSVETVYIVYYDKN